MKKVHLILLLLATSFAALAQPDVAGAPRRNEPPRIVKLKRAFVTQQLGLTGEEGKKFWPVYTSYTTDLRLARQGKKDDVLEFEENILNLRKKYRAEFKKILVSDDRVNKALTVDRDFLIVVRQEYLQRAGMRAPKKEKKNEEQPF